MSRDDGRLADLRFQAWTVQVDDQNRVRLSLELQEKVDWLSSPGGTGSVECVAVPGPTGGIQLEPLEVFESEAKSLTDALGDMPPTGSEAAADFVHLSRLYASGRRVSVLTEKTRLSIKLPEAIRTAGQLPGAGGVVIVFAFGSILEVWDAAHWYEYLRGISKSRQAILSAALEKLEHR